MSRNLIAESLLNLNKNAIMELTRGNNDKALEFFKQALFIEKEMKLIKQQAQTLVNIANTYILLNQKDKAMEAVVQAEDTFRVAKCERLYLETVILEGIIQVMMNNDTFAQSCFENVLRKSNDNKQKGDAYCHLFNMYKRKKSNYKMQESISKAIQFYDKANDKECLIGALRKRADFFLSIDKRDLYTMDLNRIDELMCNQGS